VFDVVAAPIARPASGDGSTAGATLHAVVRADVCVGCGTCVGACPEPGAITLRGKTAIVDTILCKGHGKCVDACPVGGILLATGDAVHRVEVPEVGTDFMTNVPGVYIAGELGGRGLIKNAVNEGKIAIEGIAAAIERAGGHSAPAAADAPLDVLIVGAGPAGMSAGLEAHRRGLRYLVIEQGSLGETIRKYPRDKLVLGEPVQIPLYGDLWVADSSKETLIQVWETIAANTGLAIRTGLRVEEVRRIDDTLEVRAGDRTLVTRRVLLAMGRRGTPRRLGVPGEELAKVLYEIIEMEILAGKRVLIVGGGDSAIESALGAANQPGSQVSLSYRGTKLTKVKERNIEKLERAVAADKVRLLLGTQVRRIEPDSVHLETGEGPVRMPNDYVLVRIGGEPPSAFLQRIGVRIVTKDVPLAKGEANARA
jgi:thioredoxin reductase